MQRIKPFPHQNLKNNKNKKNNCYRRRNYSGGLGSIVAEVLNDHKINKKLLRIV